MKKLTELSAEKLMEFLKHEDVVFGTLEDYMKSQLEDKACKEVETDSQFGFKCVGKCNKQFYSCVIYVTKDEFGDIVAFCKCCKPGPDC